MVEAHSEKEQIVNEQLREAIRILEDEVRQLNRWAKESASGGWSTHQVMPMRKRAKYLQDRINALKVQAHGL